jgi:hypothetical protein
VTSAEGAIDDSAPQIADRRERFRSRIREVVRGRTEEREALAVERSARGPRAGNAGEFQFDPQYDGDHTGSWLEGRIFGLCWASFRAARDDVLAR